ncbi:MULTISPECIES: hypothetical protein [unclassified Curtobacterium]|uniref:hypothetical protein n=1 Tax=unclassified Curtobacterium TaxID=257496 RepID=UPI000DAAAD93|nr:MULTISPECIES: hypothetical protein [unclassified Curtobacterium]PZE69743.1 hypothetical protein DEI83_01475 [Curtobacterium sp. MCBD17_021]WIB26340.1 hypothetical protein DEJ18_15015 [Curtobacterium sp. MCSS17_015]
MTTLRAKTTATLVGLATVGLLLGGCSNAGAQNGNPVGKVPGSEESATRSDPGQRNSAPCGVASSAAVDVLDEAVGPHDGTDVVSVTQSDEGWYLGVSVAPNTSDDPNDDEVGIWGTEEDPTAEDFDGMVFPVNKVAEDVVADEQGSATAAPSAFSETSKAAKQVQSCIVEAVDH